MKENSMLLFDKEALHFREKNKKNYKNILESTELPIHPRTFDWKLLDDPERIGKKFEFSDFKTMFSFVLNLMDSTKPMPVVGFKPIAWFMSASLDSSAVDI